MRCTTMLEPPLLRNLAFQHDHATDPCSNTGLLFHLEHYFANSLAFIMGVSFE